MTGLTPNAFVPVAITNRNELDESVHFGAVVALGPGGDVEYSAGDPCVEIYPRSANKPMQAVAMVRAGLRLPDDLLALVCASHDGTPAHVDAARRILDTAGLDDASLANTADYPLDPSSARDVIRHDQPKRAIYMNCSGKHSGMVATCVCNEWPHDESYLDQIHPLQRRITATIADLADEEPSHIGVDGCGAPAHVMSLLGLARCFRAIATGEAGDAGIDVHRAMTAHPVMVGGERRDVTAFIRAVPGLMAKDGAEGVFAAALPDGRAVALKIADGANRARPPVMVAALARLGIDVGTLAPMVEERMLGHGRQVGVVRSVLA
jgi:L-asparaginase II